MCDFYSCARGQKCSLCNHHKSNCANDIVSQSGLPGATWQCGTASTTPVTSTRHLFKPNLPPPTKKKKISCVQPVPAVTQHCLSLAAAGYCTPYLKRTTSLLMTPQNKTNHCLSEANIFQTTAIKQRLCRNFSLLRGKTGKTSSKISPCDQE